MPDFLNRDFVLVIMLGAAIWTSLQLRRAPRTTLFKLSRLALAEGVICCVVWAFSTMLSRWDVSSDIWLQSAWAGVIWALFVFVARVPFQLYPEDRSKS